MFCLFCPWISNMWKLFMPHTVASPAQGSLAENSFYHSAENHADVTSSYAKRLKNSDPVVILEPLTVSICICEVSLLSKSSVES